MNIEIPSFYIKFGSHTRTKNKLMLLDCQCELYSDSPDVYLVEPPLNYDNKDIFLLLKIILLDVKEFELHKGDNKFELTIIKE